MSFYGDIKRVHSSPYVFDKIYPNRTIMDDKCASDGVYIGRYVLIEYNCCYENENSDELVYFDRINADSENSSIDERYQANVTADITKYKDTFNATVWQKIYTNVKEDSPEKYILIAKLSGNLPTLGINAIPPKYIQNSEEYWTDPSINIAGGNEESYIFNIADVIKLDVDNNGSSLIDPAFLDPAERSEISPLPIGDENASMFDSNNNYMRWNNYYDDTPIEDVTPDDQGRQFFDTKKLETKLNGVGQSISNLYDILYGIPSGGTGTRPYFMDNDDITDLLNNLGNIGLLGILSSIGSVTIGDGTQDTGGRILQAGDYFYLATKWTDALEDPHHFIENIPQVIGASSSAGGSIAESHCYIDFNNPDNGNYIKSMGL